LERVLASDSANAKALVLLGRVALEQGDALLAEKNLTRAIEHSPDDHEAIHQLILALRILGKNDEADRLAPRLEAIRQDIERLDKLIRQIAYDPEDAALRHDAGVVALRLGRDDDGVRWLESALRCPGDHRASHAALAEHFARHDDPRADLHRRLAQGP
jgi:tetratricopeptide (TPR) repeat protein